MLSEQGPEVCSQLVALYIGLRSNCTSRARVAPNRPMHVHDKVVHRDKVEIAPARAVCSALAHID